MSTEISGPVREQFLGQEPKTPTYIFFKNYAATVDRREYNIGSPLRYYSPNVVYHNQNGATYHGAAQMWPWMQDLFKPFERLEHLILMAREIPRADGSFTADFRILRRLWVKGNTSDKPDVEVPVWWECNIGPAETPEGFNGLQMKESWIFWDTSLLEPVLPKNAVVFRAVNPMDS